MKQESSQFLTKCGTTAERIRKQGSSEFSEIGKKMVRLESWEIEWMRQLDMSWEEMTECQLQRDRPVHEAMETGGTVYDAYAVLFLFLVGVVVWACSPWGMKKEGGK